MGPDSLFAFMPIPIVAIVTWGAIRVVKIRAQSRVAGADPETAGRLQALEQQVGTLRQELSETQERLDFAERVLAQGPETRRVGPQG
jgi:hypothetical protein